MLAVVDENDEGHKSPVNPKTSYQFRLLRRQLASGAQLRSLGDRGFKVCIHGDQNATEVISVLGRPH
jgi:hypothetical protein